MTKMFSYGIINILNILFFEGFLIPRHLNISPLSSLLIITCQRILAITSLNFFKFSQSYRQSQFSIDKSFLCSVNSPFINLVLIEISRLSSQNHCRSFWQDNSKLLFCLWVKEIHNYIT